MDYFDDTVHCPSATTGKLGIITDYRAPSRELALSSRRT